MDKSIFKIIRKDNDENIEFYANVRLEPNSSLEIENCIRQKLHPISELKYRFDLWFDDNDSGYFIKDNIRVNIHYGVMSDFSFEIDKKIPELEIVKVIDWIEKIYLCLITKEKLKTAEVSKEKFQDELFAENQLKDSTKANNVFNFINKILKKF